MKWVPYIARYRNVGSIIATRVLNHPLAWFTAALSALTPLSYAEPRVYHLSLSVGELIHNREPMLPSVPMDKWGTAVRWEIGLEWNRAFWDNRIAYESCYQKICTASWAYQLGYMVTKNIDVYWEHKSQHTFDRPNAYERVDRYPLQDAVMLRVNFIDEKRFKE